MMDSNPLKDAKALHFVGIGGIGVSAVARMCLVDGKEVTGSDSSHSEITSRLEALGAKVSYGHAPGNVPAGADLLVYTPAAKPENPELVRARELGIPAVSYPEALGLISKGKRTIAVAGTHGKTTTTAMIAKVLADAGLDPTVIVGALLQGTGSNYRQGSGEWFVVEACEYKRSFLSLWPTVLVITNIEEDHLDYYKDIADIQGAFSELVRRVPPDGAVVCNPSDKNLAAALEGARCKIVDYAQQTCPALAVPGRHNELNAAAAVSAAEFAGVPAADARASLRSFAGVWRRFEYKGVTPGGALVYDDYAHHPTEIAATLEGARSKYPHKRLVAVFQPHLYSRTREHLKGFQEALSAADEVIVAPIYAARETDDRTVSHRDIAEGVRGVNALAVADLGEAVRLVRERGEGEVVVAMGAGDLSAAIPDALAPVV